MSGQERNAWTDIESRFEGKRVLVTGHTGFTGGWLCLWLNALGAQVTGLSRTPITSPNLFDAANIESVVQSCIGDICDPDAVAAAFRVAEPEIIFHLAAQPIVGLAFDDPLETFATNMMGTAQILEAARNTSSVKAVVCVTTDKVYEDQKWAWAYRESDRLGGKGPYAASKAAAELVAAAYQSSLAQRANGVAIATARGGNIVGGGDWSAHRIVPDFVRAHAQGEPLELRNPQAVRPWQHVLALCHGYLVLADRLVMDPTSAIGAWNFGPTDDEVRTVGELVSALSKAWPGIELQFGEGTFPETEILRVDSTSSKAKLGWGPPLGFQDTVELTAHWYRNFVETPEDCQRFTRIQIDEYRRLLKRDPQ